MKNFAKLGEVDTLLPLASIKPEMWMADTYLRDFAQGPFGDTESVILRFPPRSVLETMEELEKHNSTVDQHENVWLPVAAELPLLKNLVFDLARVVEATRIGRVMINKMNPGGKIYRHADTPAHANYWSRFHIVLHALPGNDFHCGDEMVNMLTNDIWYFDNRLEHEVHNNSSDPRIHMVVDFKTEMR